MIVLLVCCAGLGYCSPGRTQSSRGGGASGGVDRLVGAEEEDDEGADDDGGLDRGVWRTVESYGGDKKDGGSKSSSIFGQRSMSWGSRQVTAGGEAENLFGLSAPKKKSVGGVAYTAVGSGITFEDSELEDEPFL